MRLTAACGLRSFASLHALCAEDAALSAPAKEPAAIVRAESAMDQQQWPEAEPILRKLVAANAKDARAWFDLGYVMHAQQNYPEAIPAYRGAVAAQPDSFECNLNLGLMLAHENHPEASKYLEMATHLKPTGEHPQESLARAWAALARVQQIPRSQQRAGVLVARRGACARQCASIASPSAQRWSNRAMQPEREREFRKANELLPRLDRMRWPRSSNLFMRAQRLPEAEETLRRLVAAAPQDESAHLQLGRVLSAEKKDAEASAELQKALALRADDWDALRELAFVQERGKQYAAAESSYRTLLTHFPQRRGAAQRTGFGAARAAQIRRKRRVSSPSAFA